MLEPNGQFGTRLLGGKDSASPRYIFTKLSNITPLLFPKADMPLLNYLNDDGYSIEPDYYLPILPTVLINGCKGIGTGYSTDIPCFNPLDIIKLIELKMQGKDISGETISPYYHNFKGSITKKENTNGFITKGCYKLTSISTVEITELPIGMWTETYKEFLDSILIDTATKKKGKITIANKKILKSYTNHSTESKVHFILKFNPVVLNQLKCKSHKDPNCSYLEKRLNLTSSKNMSNMHLYDENNRICKFTSIQDIISHFYNLRLQLYVKRKQYQIKNIQKELDVLEAKAQFISDFINQKIEIRNRSKQQIYDTFSENNYPKFDLSNNVENKNPSYDYLIKMPIYSLTKEKFEELLKLRDLKKGELNLLKSKTEIDIWKAELKEFTKIYKKEFLSKKNSYKKKKPKQI